MRTSFTISLDPIKDKDVIQFLSSMSGSKRSKLIVELVDDHLHNTTTELLQLMRSINKRLESVEFRRSVDPSREAPVTYNFVDAIGCEENREEKTLPVGDTIKLLENMKGLGT